MDNEQTTKLHYLSFIKQKLCSKIGLLILSNFITFSLLVATFTSLIILVHTFNDPGLTCDDSGIIDFEELMCSKDTSSKYFYNSHALQQSLIWRNILISTSNLTQQVSQSPDAFDARYWDDCKSDTNLLRMLVDPMCTQLWLTKLQVEKAEKLSDILAVVVNENEEELIKEDAKLKAGQNGGAAVLLADSTKAYFKPCYGNTQSTETYFSEIIAFHIDRLAGFHRVSPVIPKFFSKYELQTLAFKQLKNDHQAISKVDTFWRRCGSKLRNVTGSEGAFVAWHNFPVINLTDNDIEETNYTIRLDTLSEKEINHYKETLFNINNDRSTDAEKLFPLENIQLQIFSILTGWLSRWGHNIFVIKHNKEKQSKIIENADKKGYIVYLDNDRTQWDNVVWFDEQSVTTTTTTTATTTTTTTSSSSSSSFTTPTSFLSFCKFPKQLALNLLMLSPRSGRSVTLGSLVYETVNSFKSTNRKEIFTKKQQKVLDANLKFVTDAIELCITRDGIENVLIEEPWPTSYPFFQMYSSVQSTNTTANSATNKNN